MLSLAGGKILRLRCTSAAHEQIGHAGGSLDGEQRNPGGGSGESRIASGLRLRSCAAPITPRAMGYAEGHILILFFQIAPLPSLASADSSDNLLVDRSTGLFCTKPEANLWQSQ